MGVATSQLGLTPGSKEEDGKSGGWEENKSKKIVLLNHFLLFLNFY